MFLTVEKWKMKSACYRVPFLERRTVGVLGRRALTGGFFPLLLQLLVSLCFLLLL